MDAEAGENNCRACGTVCDCGQVCVSGACWSCTSDEDCGDVEIYYCDEGVCAEIPLACYISAGETGCDGECCLGDACIDDLCCNYQGTECVDDVECCSGSCVDDFCEG